MSEVKRWPDVQGIKGTARRCKAENLGVTEYQLRMAIRSGELPVRLACRFQVRVDLLAQRAGVASAAGMGRTTCRPRQSGGIVPVY